MCIHVYFCGSSLSNNTAAVIFDMNICVNVCVITRKTERKCWLHSQAAVFLGPQGLHDILVLFKVSSRIESGVIVAVFHSMYLLQYPWIVHIEQLLVTHVLLLLWKVRKYLMCKQFGIDLSKRSSSFTLHHHILTTPHFTPTHKRPLCVLSYWMQNHEVIDEVLLNGLDDKRTMTFYCLPPLLPPRPLTNPVMYGRTSLFFWPGTGQQFHFAVNVLAFLKSVLVAYSWGRREMWQR